MGRRCSRREGPEHRETGSEGILIPAWDSVELPETPQVNLHIPTLKTHRPAVFSGSVPVQRPGHPTRLPASHLAPLSLGLPTGIDRLSPLNPDLLACP